MCGDIILHILHVVGMHMKELVIGRILNGYFLEGLKAGHYPLRMLTLDELSMSRGSRLEA